MTYKEALEKIQNGDSKDLEQFLAMSEDVARIENIDVGTENEGVAVIIRLYGGYFVRVYNEKGDSKDFVSTEINAAMKIATSELYKATR